MVFFCHWTILMDWSQWRQCGVLRKEKLCCNCCRFFLAVRLLVLIYSGGYGFGGGIFVNLSSGAAVIRPSALFVGDKLLSTCCSFTYKFRCDMVLCRGSVTSADHVSTAALVQRLSWRVAPLCILCCRAAVCIRIPADQQSYNLSLFLWHRHLVYIMFQRRSLCPSYFLLLTFVLVAATNMGHVPMLVSLSVGWTDASCACYK